MLSATYPSLSVETLIYPTYDTRGSLTVAVDNFVEWLISTTVHFESKPLLDEKTGAPRDPKETGRGGGAGSVKIGLCGHSMGGIIAAESTLNIAKEGGSMASAGGKLWPRIMSVIAYDTPYLGVHPGVFKNSFEKYGGYIRTATDLGSTLAPFGAALGATLFGSSAASAASGKNERSATSKSSSTSTWAWAAGAAVAALGAGAAGAGIYANRSTLGQSYTWVSDHLAFVGNLWDTKNGSKRLEEIVQLPQVLFHCYYTRLSAKRSRQQGQERTFCILPKADSKAATSFTPAPNMVSDPRCRSAVIRNADSKMITSPLQLAADEVEAHVGIFNARANDDYYRMGQETARLIGKSLFEEMSSSGNQKKAQRETDEIPERAQGSRAGDVEILQEQEAQKAQLQQEANQAAEEAEAMQDERDREMERRKREGNHPQASASSNKSAAPPDDEPSPWAA